nr:hypothetical protein [Tanacetum cinerariifolium]
MLIRIDELHKFSDGTLNDVCTALDDHLKGIRMKYLPQTIWRKSDKERAAMIQAIDKQLNTRRIMRCLEKFVGGRLKILLKLNLSDHRSILTNSQVTPTKPEQMTKPYLSHCFIANCFNARHLKMEVKNYFDCPPDSNHPPHPTYETYSDEFIKSCVENLFPNPSESEGENECDVPAGFTTFFIVLFDADYDSEASDDQSLSDEDVPEKIYLNPLFDEEIIPLKIDQHPFNAESDLIDSMPNHDSSITISSKIDSLFDEFTGELTLLTSIPPGIDETDCHPEKEIRFAKRLLYDNSSPRPPKEIVSDNSNADIESFSPSPIPNEDSDSYMEEIDLSFNPDNPMPSGIEDDDYDSRRDILILEELLDNYSLSLPANESYHFDIPSPYRPPAKPPDGNAGTLNIKMLGDVFDQNVPIPNLTITHILNQEKSPDLLSHHSFEAFQPSAECPMIINGKNFPLLDVPLFYFYPLDHLKYGGIRSSSIT